MGRTPNYAKQARYARAHERLKLALEHGFYIEASMMCESIISDRLHSHLYWRVVEAQLSTWDAFYARLSVKRMFRKRPPDISLDAPASLFILIEALRLDFDDFDKEHYVNLPRRLDTWRKQRNDLAHNVIYTVPTKKTYEQEFGAFMKIAEECAVEGQQLVKYITNWDRMARNRLIGVQ